MADRWYTCVDLFFMALLDSCLRGSVSGEVLAGKC